MENALILGTAPNVLRDFVPVIFVHLQSLQKMKSFVSTLATPGEKKYPYFMQKRFSTVVILAMEQEIRIKQLFKILFFSGSKIILQKK